jgi:hypothetical protein
MNQTKFANSLALNSNLIFTNASTTTTSSSSSTTTTITEPTSPQPLAQSSIKSSMIIMPTQPIIYGTSSKQPYSEDTPSDDQQPQNNGLSLKTNILNTRKVIRTSVTPPIITTISSPTQQQQLLPQSNHLLIQTVNKKPVHSINLNQTSLTKQLNGITITAVNTPNPSTPQTTAVPSSYPSSSSRINLPISTLTPIQLTVTSTTTTPSINKITKCSQSCTASSSSSSSSSPTLGSSTAAKLILNGSVNCTPTFTENHPFSLKLQKRSLNKATTPTTTITNSIASPSPLTTSIPKILFSTTPLQIHQNQVAVPTTTTTTTNLVIPRFIITTTSGNINNSTTSTPASLLFSNTNTTIAATPINIKNISSKLSDTLNKSIIIDTKYSTANFIKTTTLVPQQQRATLNSNVIDSHVAIEAARTSLLNLQSSVGRGQTSTTTQLFSSQRLNAGSNIVTISQQPATTVTTPTTIVAFANNSSATKPNIIRKTRSKVDL